MRKDMRSNDARGASRREKVRLRMIDPSSREAFSDLVQNIDSTLSDIA
jgi:hypothetical protein